MIRKLKGILSSRVLCFLLGFQVMFLPLLFTGFGQRLGLFVTENSPLLAGNGQLNSDGINIGRGSDQSKPNIFANPGIVITGGKEANLTITKPVNATYINDIWQVQEGQLKIFLYSAYYDDRPALETPHIRVISVVEKTVNNISCLIWHSDSNVPEVVPGLKADIGAQINRGKLQLKSIIFSCKLNTPYRPEYVSIVTALQPKPTNLLKLHYPEKPPANKVIEFGHCLSVLYYNHEPLRIVEWVELLKLWGVGEFNVYASSLDSQIRHIFQDYPKGTAINFRELPDVLNDGHKNSIRLNMSPAITDCLYRNMYRYKHIVCFDTDEMIVPILHQNYSAMLKAINKENKVKHPQPSYMFRNVYFFSDLGPVDNKSNILHTQRYLRHIKPSSVGYSAKSITDPQACAGMQNHFCWQRIPKYDYQGWDTHVDQKTGMNFHFKKCHFDDYLHRPGECAKLMTNYTTHPAMKQFSHVYPAVENTLKELNLL